jgi:hypothetical protein
LKIKTTFAGRVRHLFSYQPLLKIVSLLLAVALWLYVRGEIRKFEF